MYFRGIEIIISPLVSMIYTAMSFFITISSYFKNDSAICEQVDMVMPPVTTRTNFIESVIGLLHFSGKYLLLLICSYITPCFIAFVGVIVGIYSKIGGIIIFTLYAFMCGFENLGNDFYLILFFALAGILSTYLSRINNKL